VFRDFFFEKLEAIYSEKYNAVMDIAKAKLPYFDKFYIHQKDVIAEAYYKQFNFLAMDMGTGKAQPLYSKILTPDGYITMGEIKVGDMVINSEGTSSIVEGIYRQGEISVFRVHFSDGFYADCSEDHLWICKPINLSSHLKWRVKSLRELMPDLKMKTKERDLNKWLIPKVKPVVFSENTSEKLPIDPYLLGVLLGDGCLVKSISISTNDDDEIIPFVRELLPEGMVIKKQKGDNYSWNITNKEPKSGGENPLINIIRDLGLFNLRSHEKSIPRKYLFASIQDRISLLQGLLDTDGHITQKNSRISMSTVSPFLLRDIIFLVQSLGGIATVTNDLRVDRRDCYQININLPNNITPFRLKRRLERFHPKKRLLARKIVRVEYLGKHYCQCIKVNSKDSSYVTDNFIVTHNTITSATLSRIHSFPRTVIICPAAVKFNWFRDLTKKFGFNELLFTILDAARRRTIIALNERFVIINYDIVTKFESHLTSMKVDHFILDEAHNLKGINTNRVKNVLRVLSQFKDAKVTFLSGTPIKNRVDDVFSYLKLSGHELGSNHKKFLSEFTISANGRGGERVTGGRNLKDLNLKLSNFMIRKTKEDCLDLPDKVFLSYRFELEDYREEYDKIIKALSEMKEISSLTGNLHSLNIITSKAKIPGIIEIAEQIIAEGRKVVIFGSYKEPLAVLEKHFGHRCVKIDGSVDSYNRDVLVQRFIEDEECTVFLGNMIAAGVGINLVNSSDVLFMNFPFTPSELYQSIDRVHRIGQDKSVNVHLTFCDASIDDYIYEIIIDKEKDINAVIDQGKETMAKENFTEILMRKLLGREVPEHILEDEAKAEEHRDVIISSITKADDSDLPVFL